MERDRFEEEARRVRPRLVSEARRLLGDPDDADDAVQDAMLKLWFYRERLDGYSSFDAPAIVTVRRVCLNRLRSLRPHADISEAER
ncbi:sigma factor, partial [Paramuribaculum intestinale]